MGTLFCKRFLEMNIVTLSGAFSDVSFSVLPFVGFMHPPFFINRTTKYANL